MDNLVKKKSALVFTVPYNHAFALATVLFDLKKYSPNLVDDIIVYHNGIKPQDQDLLNSILSVSFVEYQFPLLQQNLNLKDTVTKYFTLMIFSRFEALNLLDDYHCVLYSDYDVVIKGDLSSLIKTSQAEWSVIPSKSKVREMFYQCIEDYDMERESFSGGLYILRDSLPNYKLLYEWCFFALKKYSEFLYMPDIAIFCLLWQEFNIEVSQHIDANIYCCYPSDSVHAAHAKILHCWGQPKYWNGFYSEQWEENYSRWIEMGGTPCFERKLLYKLKNRLKFMLKLIFKKT